MVVVAALKQSSSALPRHEKAEKSRPKLSEIGEDGVAQAVVVTGTPLEVLEDLHRKVREDGPAEFSSVGDGQKVRGLLREFTWGIRRGVEQSVEQHKASTMMQHLGCSRLWGRSSRVEQSV